MKNRFDIGTRLVDRLMQRRLRYGFIEIDDKQFLFPDQRRAFSRHKQHLIAVRAARAEMRERVA